ncbi:hypothetical protein BMS3Bbin11_01295 [bacterium BMS3Bbin11]|nr:hypothetical protein BMS3Abin11_02298 [bacterium BMS3Abin11]GBE46198.1 hypothetical protein BMS3Bbin11_01295 [bacterium BMS3Bbin11]GMT39700.1 MAG: hypothetical protein IEMM0001_0435 [bacterium]HDH08635.1 hypothetical protein [Gammaproteobacteria bacterium]HDH15583.1 hypothetical protein [Gammaproteobacteria bacterium]
MNLEKVVFAFFIVLALTVNFGFFVGEMNDPLHHNVYELYVAIVVNLIATILKFGDRTHIGAVLLATSLVADLHLIAAAVAWSIGLYVLGMGNDVLGIVVSLSGGALLANITSVVLLVVETMSLRK